MLNKHRKNGAQYITMNKQVVLLLFTLSSVLLPFQLFSAKKQINSVADTLNNLERIVTNKDSSVEKLLKEFNDIANGLKNVSEETHNRIEELRATLKKRESSVFARLWAAHKNKVFVAAAIVTILVMIF